MQRAQHIRDQRPVRRRAEEDGDNMQERCQRERKQKVNSSQSRFLTLLCNQHKFNQTNRGTSKNARGTDNSSTIRIIPTKISPHFEEVKFPIKLILKTLTGEALLWECPSIVINMLDNLRSKRIVATLQKNQ